MRNERGLKNSMGDTPRYIEFTEIDFYEEEPGVGIPPREAEKASGEQLAPVSFYSRDQHFVQEARKWAHEQGEAAPFVPFMSYWPTYEHMMESQRKWYFYWRSEVRNGRYPDTDLSYIFVYVYELINGVGWADPNEGYEMLASLAAAYGGKYPQLNGYLIDWAADYVMVHALDIPFSNIAIRFGGSLDGELLNIELLRLFREEPINIPLSLLLTLSDYELRRSKFVQGIGKSVVEEYVPRVIAMLDVYFVKKTQTKLIERFMPDQEQVIHRYLFRSAVYDDSLYGRAIKLTYVPISNHRPLRRFITHVIRYTENKLRELKGYRGRLREFILEAEVERLIDRYLEKEFEAKSRVQPNVTIDPDKLASLLVDTEHVQNLLTISNEDEVDLIEGMTDQEGLFLEPVESEEVLSVEKLSTDTQAANGTDHPEAELPVDAFVSDGKPPKKLHWDTSGLDEEWSMFASSLDDYHIEALCALRSASPQAELARVADTYGTMAELVIDEINNIAMETIGDLVIDGDQIAQEYAECFEKLKGESS
ncbi:TerB N-terminal domain-containing protein [Paenibacillus puldeungensis]|uniref:TerB N-terminal domain-containing protein n=1 Tax=Paenibacillus puldeungensis TaxID=696536 RepID=A0ABW3S172_9BACL